MFPRILTAMASTALATRNGNGNGSKKSPAAQRFVAKVRNAPLAVVESAGKAVATVGRTVSSLVPRASGRPDSLGHIVGGKAGTMAVQGALGFIDNTKIGRSVSEVLPLGAKPSHLALLTAIGLRATGLDANMSGVRGLGTKVIEGQMPVIGYALGGAAATAFDRWQETHKATAQIPQRTSGVGVAEMSEKKPEEAPRVNAQV